MQMLVALSALMAVGFTVELKDEEIKKLPEVLKTRKERPLTVKLSGTVYLDSTLELGPEASDVTLQGPALISGGVLVKDWSQGNFHGFDVSVAKLPFTPVTLRQVFVGDQRLSQTQFPGEGGFFRFANYVSDVDRSAPWNTPQNQMLYVPDTLDPEWQNIGDVEVVVHHYWVTSRMKIKSFDVDKKLVQFDRNSIWKLSDDYGSDNRPGVFCVQNVAELIWQPDTFYYDRPTGQLSSSERIKSAVVPRLSQLLRVKGAKDFSVENIDFAHTEVDLGPTVSGDIQAGYTVPAAVVLTDCENPKVVDCEFKQLGGWGLDIAGDKAIRALVSKSSFRDLGAGSIKLENNTTESKITDNVIKSGGRIFASACGIWGGQTGGNRIEHNRIEDFYYTGISLGWDWGFADTAAKNNRIAFNDISNIGQGMLSDMGGIYVLGKQPNSVIENNRIENVNARGYGGWGIYLDEGSTGWTVENNLVVDTKTGGFHIHYGRDNLIRNNVFVGSQTDAQLIRVRDDQQGPITFERNVVVSLDPEVPIVGPNWLSRDVTMRGNIYWSPVGRGGLPKGDDGTGKWLNPKLDRSFLPTNGELKRLGFKPISMNDVGPR